MNKATQRRRLTQLLVAAPIAAVTVSLGWPNAEAGTTNDDNVDDATNNSCNPLLAHSIRPLMGSESQPLCDLYSGKVLLMVNTASRCGFTPQLADLEKLHRRYSNEGFQVLAFPSDDFRQELTTEKEIAKFCEINYGVSFPVFQKISVRTDNAHPVYKSLAQATGIYPRWNFNKYLIDRTGQVVSHYDSNVQPLGTALVADIEKLL